MGRIAAGMPIEALQNAATPSRFRRTCSAKGEHYALEVKGDSMIDAGILDGDTVIIRNADAAEQRRYRRGAGG